MIKEVNMCKNEDANETKYVGGPIPINLYWKYTEVRVKRQEGAAEALINALNLYIDLPDKNNEEGEH